MSAAVGIVDHGPAAHYCGIPIFVNPYLGGQRPARKLVARRWHAYAAGYVRRVDKKWVRRYGMVDVPQIVTMPGRIFMSQAAYEMFRKAVKS